MKTPPECGAARRSTQALEEALVGLNGWYRWSKYAAHFFVDGRQTCNYRHPNFEHQNRVPAPPTPAHLTPEGSPFGRVCMRCLKLWRQR